MTKSLTIKARLGITMAFLGALLIAIGGLGLAGMSRSNDAFLETFSDQMPSAIAVGNTELYAARERLVFDRAALLVGTDEVTATVARARMMRERADAYWKEYSALPQGPAEKQLADAAQAKRLALQKRVDAGLEAIAAADHDRIIAEAKAMQATYNDLSTANDALRRALTESARDGYESAQHTFSLFRTLSLLAIAAGLVAAAFAWFSLRRAIARPLDEALGHFDAIAVGDLRRTVDRHVRATKWACCSTASRRCRPASSRPSDGALAAANRSRRRPRRSRPAISTCRRARKSRRRRCRKRRRAWSS